MATIPPPAEVEWQEMHISDSLVPDIIAVNAVCFTIACVSVALRFVSRRMAKVKYGLDDWLVLASLCFTLGTVVTSLLGLRYGAGRHVIAVRNPAGFAKALICAEVIWCFAITTVKGSILYLYHRIFSFNNRSFSITLWIVGIFIIGYCLTQTFAATFQCVPIDSQWHPEKPRTCVPNIDLGATIIASFNVLTDFVILILPMPLLYKLQRPLREKLSIMGIFLLGGLVCFASVYRTILIHLISYTDPTWSDVKPDMWTIAELSIGILSACLPTYRPLFNRGKYNSKYKSGSGLANVQDQSHKGSGADQGLARQQFNSIPSVPESPNTPLSPAHDKEFSHIGVLGNVEQEKPEEQV